jgi:hypothetical protein
MSNQTTPTTPTTPPGPTVQTGQTSGTLATNDLIEKWRIVMSTTLLSHNGRFDLEVLLQIFCKILSETETFHGQKVSGVKRLQMWSVIGVVFFSDRLLINSLLLCQFLRWNEHQVERILNCEEFRGSALSCRQFGVLQSEYGLHGSKFDWHIHHYPRLIESQDLLSRVSATCSESFYQITAGGQSPGLHPRLSRSFTNQLVIASDNIPRLKYAHLSMKDILGLYSGHFPEDKCWLLSATNE